MIRKAFKHIPYPQLTAISSGCLLAVAVAGGLPF